MLFAIIFRLLDIEPLLLILMILSLRRCQLANAHISLPFIDYFAIDRRQLSLIIWAIDSFQLILAIFIYWRRATSFRLRAIALFRWYCITPFSPFSLIFSLWLLHWLFSTPCFAFSHIYFFHLYFERFTLTLQPPFSLLSPPPEPAAEQRRQLFDEAASRSFRHFHWILHIFAFIFFFAI